MSNFLKEGVEEKISEALEKADFEKPETEISDMKDVSPAELGTLTPLAATSEDDRDTLQQGKNLNDAGVTMDDPPDNEPPKSQQTPFLERENDPEIDLDR